MAITTDPYTFTNGTVANALEVNARFNALYNLDVANITWTGTHTFNNNVTIGTDKKLYFRDTNAYLQSSSATDMVWYVDATLFLTLGNSAGTRFIQSSQNLLLAGNKLAFDGVANSTNYLQYTGGSYVTYLDSTLYLTMGNSAGNRFIQSSQNLLLANNKLITDGSATGDTYIQESSANVLDTFVGGAQAVRTLSEGILLPDTDPPTANYINRNSGCKAWLEYTDDSGSVSTSYNIDSVADDDGDGSYDVYIDTNMSSSSYASIGTPSSTFNDRFVSSALSFDSGRVIVNIYDVSAAGLVDDSFSICVFGDQ